MCSSIDNELKAGRHVKPQMFDSVSIYFADIVCYTPLAARSNPIEIAELLHDIIFSTFDDAFLGRDVHKVIHNLDHVQFMSNKKSVVL